MLGWIDEQFQADGHEVDPANTLDYHVRQHPRASCGCSVWFSRPVDCQPGNTTQFRAKPRSP
jgi:hypothetical protein